MKSIPKSLCSMLTMLILYVPTASLACMCLNDFQRIKTLEDLKTYEFVALVKVTSETVSPPSGTPFREARLGLKIIEKFKGKDIGEMIERDVQSSCDMGIEVGDEWVLFATTFKDKVLVSACNSPALHASQNFVVCSYFLLHKAVKNIVSISVINGNFTFPFINAVVQGIFF